MFCLVIDIVSFPSLSIVSKRVHTNLQLLYIVLSSIVFHLAFLQTTLNNLIERSWNIFRIHNGSFPFYFFVSCGLPPPSWGFTQFASQRLHCEHNHYFGVFMRSVCDDNGQESTTCYITSHGYSNYVARIRISYHYGSFLPNWIFSLYQTKYSRQFLRNIWLLNHYKTSFWYHLKIVDILTGCPLFSSRYFSL